MIEASAPGRVNLIGDHTDYNAGFVLPLALPAAAHVQVEQASGDTVKVTSREMGRDQYRLGQERPDGSWADYVRGCTATLSAAGHRIGGVTMRIESDVPLGSGLASSAALEVAVLRALREAFGLTLDDLHLALLAQRVETDFVGVPVGAMDQLASSLGQVGEALLIDMRSLEPTRIGLPEADLFVITSGIEHQHATGEYRIRRAECQHAADLLGVGSLRDIAADDLPRVRELPPPLDRRVRHVVTENARVLEAAAAMLEGAPKDVGDALRASHASLRDDFEVSLPALDLLVELANQSPDVYGARLTGGGFGGSIVGLSAPGTAERVTRSITRAYREITGMDAGIVIAGRVVCNAS